MRTLKVLMVVFVLCIAAQAWSGLGQAAVNGTVVTIDDDAFSAEDFRNWWLNWRDKDMAVPATLDPYVDWQLFAREAERMALFDDAQYQHEVNVYLQVISLVNLKYEEIDSKIDFSEASLWAYYQEQFSPQWLLNVLIYKDLESAEKAYTNLRAGKVTVADLAKIAGERSRQEQAQNPHGGQSIDVEELKKMSGAEEKLLGVHEKAGRRPYGTEKKWREVIAGLDKGAFSRPFPWQESYVVLQLVDTAPADKEDFAKMKSSVQNRYRKYREAVLTNELVGQLKKKYAVRIDEERIDKLDPAATEAGYSEAPVITFSTMNVSEKQLMDKVVQDMEFNKQYGFKPEDTKKIVRRVLDGMISQTLTTMESLDRHYERKSPTRELFEFHKRHKLVKRLEAQIRSQGKEASEPEKEAFYKEHIADFTTPQVYKMAVIEGAEEELKKIWLEVVVNGKDIMVVAEERLGHKPEVVSYPSNHLSPEVKERASALNKGDLSQVFSSDKGFVMLYMVESTPSRTEKYEDIKGMIGKKLAQDRYTAAKDEYLAALRKKARIEMNDGIWAELREELVKENEKK